MHGFHKAIEKRLTALERLVGSIAAPETTAESDRRLVLVHSAHVGHEPEDLTEEEVLTFQKIVASLPVFRELVHEGLVDHDGEPGDGIETEDGELVWEP